MFLLQLLNKKVIIMLRTHLRMVEARLGSLEKGVVDLPPGVTQ